MRATGARSCSSKPTNRIAAPPGLTSGRHHSSATGGGASALATTTPKASTSCSSARPQTTLRFGKSPSKRWRKRHLRSCDSINVTVRSGKAAARGIPGAPPPEPTSATGPSKRATSAVACRLSATCSRLACSGSRIEVSPGVPSRASSQRPSRGSSAGSSSGGICRQYDHVAAGVVSLARRGHSRVVLQTLVYEPALIGAHRLQSLRLAAGEHPLGSLQGRVAEGCFLALAITTRIDRRSYAPRTDLLVNYRVCDLLDRVDCLAATADQHAEIAAREADAHRLGLFAQLDLCIRRDNARDRLCVGAQRRCELALLASRRIGNQCKGHHSSRALSLIHISEP